LTGSSLKGINEPTVTFTAKGESMARVKDATFTGRSILTGCSLEGINEPTVIFASRTENTATTQMAKVPSLMRDSLIRGGSFVTQD
jgi:hypothetical protein